MSQADRSNPIPELILRAELDSRACPVGRFCQSAFQDLVEHDALMRHHSVLRLQLLEQAARQQLCSSGSRYKSSNCCTSLSLLSPLQPACLQLAGPESQPNWRPGQEKASSSCRNTRTIKATELAHKVEARRAAALQRQHEVAELLSKAQNADLAFMVDITGAPSLLDQPGSAVLRSSSSRCCCRLDAGKHEHAELV